MLNKFINKAKIIFGARVPVANRIPTVGPDIAIVNHCSQVSAIDVTNTVAAIQVQIDRDFVPVWNLPANLVVYQPNDVLPANSWVMHIMDTSDQAGALGYHELTPAGNPIGYVFAADDIKYGLSWSVTLSHELLEMLGDPYINTSIFAQTTNTTGTLYAYENCFTGDTKISLLNGTEVPIKDLVGQDTFWVYSINEEGNIRPGKGYNARKTATKVEILKITLDNGESFKCTPNHRIMLRDGTYIEAKDLKSGISLMPLYRRKQPIQKNSNLTYEQTFNPYDNDWKFTHKIVEGRCPSGYVRHHKDFNRFNNSPDNLEVIKWDDHVKIHNDAIYYVHQLPQTKEARRRNALKMNASHKGKKRPELSVQRNFTDEQRKATGERGRQAFLQYNGSEKHLNAIIGNKNLEKIRNRPDVIEKLKTHSSELMKKINQTEEHKELLKKVFQTEEFKKSTSENAKIQNHIRWHEKRNKPSPNCEHCLEHMIINHKVVSVESCGFDDVYDITVEKYHNFALSAGVFVHNCDAVEDDQFAYKINGILVSDWVFPAWFQEFREPNSTQFSFKNNVHAPFELATGGYIGAFEVGPNSQGWTQLTPASGIGKRLASKGTYSRKARRFTKGQ